MNAGVRRPDRNVRISLALLLASVTALVAGIIAMRSAGAESTASATAIALGLLGTIIFSFMLANFVWATRVFAAIKRGQNVIARWTVPADAFDRRDRARRSDVHRFPDGAHDRTRAKLGRSDIPDGGGPPADSRGELVA